MIEGRRGGRSLRLARIRKAHQPEIAELFASIILDRPGFFDGDDAQDLYTLRRSNWPDRASPSILPTIR